MQNGDVAYCISFVSFDYFIYFERYRLPDFSALTEIKGRRRLGNLQRGREVKKNERRPSRVATARDETPLFEMESVLYNN